MVALRLPRVIFPSLVAASALQPRDYADPWRPQVHYTPPANWMNDPNGLCRDGEGLWHYYYQYNPSITPNEKKAWGHATSPDLYSWTEHPIAINYDDVHSIWSGSVVVDVNNTSGFFPDQTNGIAAFYTDFTAPDESQWLAISRDGGYTFENYPGNPIIDLDQHGFRDPKVLWHEETQKWVLVVSHADEHFIAFYTSTDLVKWTQVSTYRNPGFRGVFECPNFVRLPFKAADGTVQDMWVLLISLGGGGPNGSGIVASVPGTFDGTTFTPVDNRTDRVFDFAQDIYATQFFHNPRLPGNEAVSISWAVNIQYAGDVPTGPAEGWVSAASGARIHWLANVTNTGWDLISAPYDPAPLYLPEPVLRLEGARNGAQSVSFSASVPSRALFYRLAVPPTATGALVTLKFIASSTNETIPLTLDLTSSPTFSMSRANIGTWNNSNVVRTFSVPLLSTTANGRAWVVEGIMDKTILEVYVDQGAKAGTMIFFPSGEFDTVEFGVEGLPDESEGVDVEVRGLKSGWTGI